MGTMKLFFFSKSFIWLVEVSIERQFRWDNRVSVELILGLFNFFNRFTIPVGWQTSVSRGRPQSALLRIEFLCFQRVRKPGKQILVLLRIRKTLSSLDINLSQTEFPKLHNTRNLTGQKSSGKEGSFWNPVTFQQNFQTGIQIPGEESC